MVQLVHEDRSEVYSSIDPYLHFFFVLLITKHTDISSWLLTFGSCAGQGSPGGLGGLPRRAALLARFLQCFRVVEHKAHFCLHYYGGTISYK